MSHAPRTTPLLYLCLALLALAALSSPSSAKTYTLDSGPDLDSSRRNMNAIEKTVRRENVEDAKRQLFAGRYWARADVRSLEKLDAALTAESPERMRRLGVEFLEGAARDGRHSFEIEIARLPSESVYALARSLGCSEDPLRECIGERYQEDAALLLAADVAALDDADLTRTITWLAELRESLRPSIKTRGRVRRKALTFPAFPAVYAWRKKHSANEYEGPQPVDFEHYRVYAPERRPRGDRKLDLLARYAPVVVQETAPGASYPQEFDRIGSLTLSAGARKPMPAVDTDRPVSYSYVQELSLNGVELTQLVYTYWYPEHPKLKRIDAGAGKIEGITLRVTLDPSGRPRFYETIYNCGCSHRLFVDSGLEAAAATEFGAPEGDRPFSIQRHMEKRIDLVVPEVVTYAADQPLVFFVRAGFHLPASVKYALPEGADLRQAERYALRAYEELERMPFGDGWASIFDDKGLVRGASRTLEEVMLTPLGIYKAGHPRQRGTQLIHFDQADFDDPRLFETYLRLPSTFYQELDPGPSGSSVTTR
jgi:hypothetical protein